MPTSADSASTSNASNMLTRAAAKVWAEEAERHLREDMRRWNKEAEAAYDASAQAQAEIDNMADKITAGDGFDEQERFRRAVASEKPRG